MKVVQVLPALHGGGVERGVLELAEALVDGGHESVVVSKGGRLVAELTRKGSRHVGWDVGRKHPATLLQTDAFRRFLADERPDILHLRSRMPAWLAWLAWRRMPKATRPGLVTTVHGLYSVNAYSAVMLKGERVIAVSDTARRYVVDSYPNVDERKLRRIHRGIDPQRFCKGFRASEEWCASWQRTNPGLVGKKLIVLPGRLTRLKGHHDFIDMLNQVRNQHSDAVGVVVGDADPKHRRYEAEVRRRAIGLAFLGHRNDLREIMATAAAVVNLSTHPESFGRTVLEALSLGTPVVGYDHGGVGELLRQIFPMGCAAVGDSGAAAKALGRILDDLPQARAEVRDHEFTVARMQAETLALYAELLGERKANVL